MNNGDKFPEAIEDLKARVQALEGHPALTKAELVAAIESKPEESDVRNEENKEG